MVKSILLLTIKVSKIITINLKHVSTLPNRVSYLLLSIIYLPPLQTTPVEEDAIYGRTKER